MARNLNRLTAAANRQSAHHDFMYVWSQVKSYDPPEVLYTAMFTDDWQHTSAKKIDKITRSLINWARDQEIDFTLPDGWT